MRRYGLSVDGVSKAVLDVMILPGERLQVTDDAAGIRELVVRLVTGIRSWSDTRS